MRLPGSVVDGEGTRPVPAAPVFRVAALGCAVLVLAAVAAACGGDGSNDDRAAPRATTTTGQPPACGPEVAEPLDPSSARHLLPGAPPPEYATDPPTSGAHHVGALPSGAVKEPIPRPVQVALLEGGAVVLQYRDIAPADVAALESLAAGDDVVVAPNPDLPGPIVATAWTFKQVCQRFDGAALSKFIGARGAEAGDDHG